MERVGYDKLNLKELCNYLHLDEEDIRVDDSLVVQLCGYPIWLSVYKNTEENTNDLGIELFANLYILKLYGPITAIDELVSAVAINYNQDNFTDYMYLPDFCYEEKGENFYRFSKYPSTMENLVLYLQSKHVDERTISRIVERLDKEAGVGIANYNELKQNPNFNEDDLDFLKHIKYLVYENVVRKRVITGLKLFALKIKYHKEFNTCVIKEYEKIIKRSNNKLQCEVLQDDIEMLKKELLS